MQEENLGDPYKNDEQLKGMYERIRRWFEDTEEDRKQLDRIEKEEDDRFGGNRFDNAQDVLDEVNSWKQHIPVKRFGLEGTRNLTNGDLIFDVLIIETTQKIVQHIKQLQEDPLNHLIEEVDEVTTSDKLIMLWWD
jgi:hypothetical protein